MISKTNVFNKSCALNIAIDGSEDELIHCFKENQPCSAGLQRLKVMANTIDDEREDPFVSLSDSGPVHMNPGQWTTPG